MVLNTIFLVREIRRNEQQDSFLNAVTHELKTPVASIRLYLQTLQTPRPRCGQAARVLPHHARGQRSAAAHDRAGAARRECPIALPARGAQPGRISTMWRVNVSSSRARGSTWTTRSLAFENRTDGPRGRPWQHRGAQGRGLEPDRQRGQVLDSRCPRTRRARGAVDHDRVARARGRSCGIGISSTELKRIFRRFYRTPALGAVRTKGSGLGLFIVRSVARNHGGRAFAESAGSGPGQHADASAAEGARSLTCSASSSSKTSCTWPRGSGSISRRKGYEAEVVETGEARARAAARRGDRASIWSCST